MSEQKGMISPVGLPVGVDDILAPVCSAQCPSYQPAGESGACGVSGQAVVPLGTACGPALGGAWAALGLQLARLGLDPVVASEVERVAGAGLGAVLDVLRHKDPENAKHPPYSYRSEPQDEHLHKALRHVLTYQIQRDGQQDADGEDHLAQAIVRLCMARDVEPGSDTDADSDTD